MSHTMNAAATPATTAKNQRCQPSAPARKLNAAPLLKVSTSDRNGSSAISSPGRKVARIAALTTWSATTIATASAIQRVGVRSGEGLIGGLTSSMRPRFAAAKQVGDAASAQRGMRRVLADVAAPVPAALALGAARRVHRDRERIAALDA